MKTENPWTDNAVAFDYGKQQWVEGVHALKVRGQQLNDDRKLIASERGADYLAYIGSNQTVAEALTTIDEQLLDIYSALLAN